VTVASVDIRIEGKRLPRKDRCLAGQDIGEMLTDVLRGFQAVANGVMGSAVVGVDGLS